MQKKLFVCFFLTLLTVLSIKAQRAGTFYTNGRNIDIDTFNHQVIRMIDEAGVQGLSLAIIENNKIVYYNTYGSRKTPGNKKANKKTIFSAASLSKSFLVLAAFRLIDEGKLELDKPMYQYLVDKRLEYDPRYKLITPRMILSHSSGIENWEPQNDSSKLEIVKDPGKELVYSGEGYNYLAEVIKKLLGQSYEEYINALVIAPLKLKNTYLKFKKKRFKLFHKEFPRNYAYGHGINNKPVINKNYNTFPAAGNFTTAEDYAKLILGIFDTAYISVNSIKDLERPLVQVNNSRVFYGPGFEVTHMNGDIIISHGGDNDGFKNQMYYSVVNKRGFVFLSNSDKGRFLIQNLCNLSVRMDISPFLKSEFYFEEQYPSNASRLLKIYGEQGAGAMEAEIEELKHNGKLDTMTLNIVGYHIRWYRGGDAVIAKKLFEENIALYPNSALSYVLLGWMFKDHFKQMDAALLNLLKAKALHFSMWSIEDDIKECEARLAHH